MTHKSIYKKLSHKMSKKTVEYCLKLTQSDFLDMLVSGIQSVIKQPVSRSLFSEAVGVSPKTIYGYFASEQAQDFRRLSDDSRIAMIWRVVTKFPDNQYTHRSIHRYLINGEEVTTREAARILGYSQTGNLLYTIKKHGIEDGEDISHLKITAPGKTEPKYFIVDGELLSTNAAAKKLGYSGSGGISHKIKNLNPGDDISHLKKQERPKAKSPLRNRKIHQ